MRQGAGNVAVFDVGKTNAKLVVLDTASGRELVSHRMTNRVVRQDPYPHYDTDALWAFLIASLTAVAITPGFDAISVTTHGAAAALLDGDGELALPVLDYEHDYPQAIKAAYDRIRPDFAETFSPRLSMGLNLGAQLHYQKTVFPDDFARVRTIVTYAQYWSGRLSGQFVTEVTSLGCHTDLWNPALGRFSTLVDTLDLSGLLAPVQSAFAALGPLLAPLATEIGIEAGRDIPVHCGIHDSNASLLPHLIGREAPFSVVSTGTWVVSFGVGGDLGRLDPARDTLANVDAYGRAVPSARFMGGREYEMLTSGLEPAQAGAADAACVRAVIARGMMLLPSAVPGCGPIPERTAAWVSAEGASDAERHVAICLYLALMTQESLRLLNAGGPILVEGPFARNGLYLSALSAFSGRSVRALEGSTGTSLGAARLAGGTAPSTSAQAAAVTPLGAAAETEAYRTLWRERIATR
ncbi:FGGY-family carbohydrate kinase [Rhizobium sp. DKSPLA3]|uniref:FGGY-family carbohydrate kinase n=1 Tax=Rhizobium quercicola TaxID=2901226 RepID=A0A9X1T160_9HYPH|nr:FGGY-family carbohydrate kinase [Rhizobium quercicola]MCD7110231.1 FGGY-family carbohydrate kinase [Rhizobium quercicola]